MNVARVVTAIDVGVNLGSASVVLASATPWATLGLPEQARVPVGLAMAVSGGVHSIGLIGHGPGPRQLKTASNINAAWMTVGLLALALPVSPATRGQLLAASTYDLLMNLSKRYFAARPHQLLGRSRIGS